MANKKFRINSLKSLYAAVDEIAEMWLEFKYITLTVTDKRSLDKNALMNVWYSDISKYRGDVSVQQVTRECKLNIGTKILRRDNEMNEWLYSKSLDLLDYQRQLKLMDTMAVTREMSNCQMSEYLDEMQKQYPFLESKKSDRGSG